DVRAAAARDPLEQQIDAIGEATHLGRVTAVARCAVQRVELDDGEVGGRHPASRAAVVAAADKHEQSGGTQPAHAHRLTLRTAILYVKPRLHSVSGAGLRAPG